MEAGAKSENIRSARQLTIEATMQVLCFADGNGSSRPPGWGATPPTEKTRSAIAARG